MQFIPRSVVFEKATGKAVAIGNYWRYEHNPNYYAKIIVLPTDHYDFIGPIHCIGMTEKDIEIECSQYYGEVLKQ